MSAGGLRSLEAVRATTPSSVAPSHGGTVELIEVETSFGTVAAGEQALIEAIREVLRAEAGTPKATEDEPAR